MGFGAHELFLGLKIHAVRQHDPFTRPAFALGFQSPWFSNLRNVPSQPSLSCDLS